MEFKKLVELCGNYEIEDIQIVGVEDGSNGKAYLMFFDGKTLEEKLVDAFNKMRVFRILFPDRKLEIGFNFQHFDYIFELCECDSPNDIRVLQIVDGEFVFDETIEYRDGDVVEEIVKDLLERNGYDVSKRIELVFPDGTSYVINF